MNTKKIVKIFSILCIAIAILSVASTVLGVSVPTPNAPTSTGITSTVSNVLGIVTYICYAAAVILLVMLGIKFMTASPDGKAEVKKSAVIYVVGAILVFAAGLVINLIKGSVSTVITEK